MIHHDYFSYIREKWRLTGTFIYFIQTSFSRPLMEIEHDEQYWNNKKKNYCWFSIP